MKPRIAHVGRALAGGQTRPPWRSIGVAMLRPAQHVVRRVGDELHLPGLASAHSHAFQRGLRGLTQRRSPAGMGDFWSWRGLMYHLAEQLSPEDVFRLSRFAFAELALSGVTAVGEFHYLHHQADGTPYADRLELADAVVRAARDVGLRITLLRVLYARAGAGRAPGGAQRRFSDLRVEDGLADVEALAARYAQDPCVAVGVAPHSVRAVPRAWLGEAARFASARALPLHAHVSEQRAELEECRAEHGMTPVRLLSEEGALSARFVAVHATHLEAGEAELMGGAHAFACICRTTERDLGDGLANVASMADCGLRICLGVDSHASSCPFEEARAVELDERTRAEGRVVAAEASALLRAATADGYAALGLDGREAEDEIVLDAHDPALAGAQPDTLDESVVFGAGARAVREVKVAGRDVVHEGQLVLDYQGAREAFEACLKKLLAR